MRWLLLKDLQILRRSPLVTGLLIVYPIAIAVLIGFALSRGPEKPRVAFLNRVPVGTPLVLGGTHFNIVGARNEQHRAQEVDRRRRQGGVPHLRRRFESFGFEGLCDGHQPINLDRG